MDKAEEVQGIVEGVEGEQAYPERRTGAVEDELMLYKLLLDGLKS